MKKTNQAIAIVLLAFTAFYAWQTWELPVRNMPGTLGIDFMPWVLVFCLGFLSALLLATSLVNPNPPGNSSFSLKEAQGIVFLTILVYIYVFLIGSLGYLASTPIFLATLMVIGGSRKWLEVVLVSLCATAGIYLFFNKIFQIQLPGGTWL